MSIATSQPVHVVRQRAEVFVAFVLGGLLFVVFPWLIDDGSPWWLCLAFVAMGILSVVVGVLGWRAGRVGLVVDRRGILCGGYSLRGPLLVPWSDVRSARRVEWTDPEGESHGILVGLHQDARNPLDVPFDDQVMSQLEGLVGPVDEPNPLLLEHDEWDWDLDESLTIIQQCIENPAQQNQLGIYEGRQVIPCGTRSL